MTVRKSTLEGKRNDHEYRVIERLHECLGAGVAITVLADRGFGDQKLYRFLQTLGWDFIIRFRSAIQVEAADGTRKTASAWVPPNGRATMIRDARVTRTRAEVPAVVVVHARNMKEAWCLATTLSERKAADVVKLYGRRFTIETAACRRRAAVVVAMPRVPGLVRLAVSRSLAVLGTARTLPRSDPRVRQKPSPAYATWTLLAHSAHDHRPTYVAVADYVSAAHMVSPTTPPSPPTSPSPTTWPSPPT